MVSFSVSDIKIEREQIFINLLEKHEELSDKRTKKAEQKSILKLIPLMRLMKKNLTRVVMLVIGKKTM